MLYFYCPLRFNWSYYAFVQWNCWAVTFTNTPSLNELAYYAVLSCRNASWTKAQTSDWNALSSKTDASIHQSHHHQHKGPPWAHWRIRLNLTNTQVLIVHAWWTIAQTRAQVLMFTHGEQSPDSGTSVNVHTRWTKPRLGHKCYSFTHGEQSPDSGTSVNVHTRWTKPTSGSSVNVHTRWTKPKLGHKCYSFTHGEQSLPQAQVFMFTHGEQSPDSGTSVTRSRTVNKAYLRLKC